MTLAGRLSRMEAERPLTDPAAMSDSVLWRIIRRGIRDALTGALPEAVRVAMERVQAGTATAADETLALRWMAGEVDAPRPAGTPAP